MKLRSAILIIIASLLIVIGIVIVRSHSPGEKYVNDQYGFSIIIPSVWKKQGYFVDDRNKGLQSADAGVISFNLPNPEMNPDDPDHTIFGIKIFSKKAWGVVRDRITKGDIPELNILGENSRYVFTYDVFTEPGTDYLRKRVSEVPKIIESFKVESFKID